MSTRYRVAVRSVAILLALMVVGIAVPALRGHSADAEPMHLRLVRTSPAADTVLAASPAEVRLFFSEPPQIEGASVRVTAAADALLATSPVAPDSRDPSQLVVRPLAALTSGSYAVHWRVLARDGHAQNGTFTFRVAGG